MAYLVMFTGGIGAPRLRLHDSYSILEQTRSIAETAAKALGSEYYWCGIFDEETGKLVEEFTIDHTPQIRR